MVQVREATCQLSGEWPDVFLHVQADGLHGAIALQHCMLKNSIAEKAFEKWSKRPPGEKDYMIQLRWSDETGWKDYKKFTGTEDELRKKIEECRCDWEKHKFEVKMDHDCRFRGIIIV